MTSNSETSNSETVPSKRGGSKPSPAASHTCEECQKPFQESPANRAGAHVFCSTPCAARFRERAAGHLPPQTLPCAFCGDPVTRYASKTTGSGNVFCSRAHYLAWRHGKSDLA